MALSNIEVKTIGHYVWDEEFQYYHERIIGDFKYYFADWLAKLGKIPKTINVNINVNYYPVVGKFDLEKISTRENEILRALKEDPEFSNKYFTKL